MREVEFAVAQRQDRRQRMGADHLVHERALGGLEVFRLIEHQRASTSKPADSGRPSIRFRFCTAAPLAPLPRLSRRAIASACRCASLAKTKISMRLVPFNASGSRKL